MALSPHKHNEAPRNFQAYTLTYSFRNLIFVSNFYKKFLVIKHAPCNPYVVDTSSGMKQANNAWICATAAWLH